MEQSVTSDKDVVPEEPMTDSSVHSDATTLQTPIVDSPISSYAVNVPAPSNVAIATTSRSKRLTVLVKKTPYDRPITRTQPTTLSILTSKPAESMIVDSQVSKNDEHRLDFSSSTHAADEDAVNNILQ
ncbi:hypothetical protein G6F43_012833 [Rhizopus delemar]|nr:hypothetical protein G6F43_012833 [Rhizopus delemar]